MVGCENQRKCVHILYQIPGLQHVDKRTHIQGELGLIVYSRPSFLRVHLRLDDYTFDFPILVFWYLIYAHGNKAQSHRLPLLFFFFIVPPLAAAGVDATCGVFAVPAIPPNPPPWTGGTSFAGTAAGFTEMEEVLAAAMGTDLGSLTFAAFAALIWAESAEVGGVMGDSAASAALAGTSPTYSISTPGAVVTDFGASCVVVGVGIGVLN